MDENGKKHTVVYLSTDNNIIDGNMPSSAPQHHNRTMYVNDVFYDAIVVFVGGNIGDETWKCFIRFCL